jgi:hypothetical protein
VIVHNFDAPTTSEMKGKHWANPSSMPGMTWIVGKQWHAGSRCLHGMSLTSEPCSKRFHGYGGSDCALDEATGACPSQLRGLRNGGRFGVEWKR